MGTQPATTDVSSRFALDTNALAGLKRQAKTSPEAALKASAAQFEALFMNMLLKSMREALPQDGMLTSDTSKSYTAMFDQQIAQQLGKRGIGVADLLVKQLSRNLPQAEAAADGSAAGGAVNSVPAGSSRARTAPVPVRGDGVRPRVAAEAIPAYVRAQAMAQGRTDGVSAAGAATPATGNLPRGVAAVGSATAAGGAATAAANGAAPTAPGGPPATPAADTGVGGMVRRFVDALKPAAEAAAKLAGLPASYLLAQAGLETGWGRSLPKAVDGTSSYNLFGIKAGKSWTGPVVEATTTEYVNGRAVTSVERFRSYGSYTEALQDFAQLVGGNPRYAAAVARSADPTAFAQGLQKAGYATDPRYGEKLAAAIRMVTRYADPQPTPTQVVASRADIRA